MCLEVVPSGLHLFSMYYTQISKLKQYPDACSYRRYDFSFIQAQTSTLEQQYGNTGWCLNLDQGLEMLLGVVPHPKGPAMGHGLLRQLCHGAHHRANSSSPAPKALWLVLPKACLLTSGSERHYKIWESHGSSIKMTLITEDMGHPKCIQQQIQHTMIVLTLMGHILTDVVRYTWP